MAYHIGIITIDDSGNYGNRLQNLAMQSFLADLGYDMHTFHRIYSPWNRLTLKKIVKLLLGQCIWISKKFFKKAFVFQRFYNFYRFNKHYIAWDKHTFENLPEISYLESNYDGLVVGSDQVWNFNFYFNDKGNLLSDISPEIRKIAVAASIGNTCLSDEERMLFQKYLNQFHAVSVREQSAISLLQPYYHRNIIQICDPVLLVGRKYWDRIKKDSRLKIKKRYILYFFLGTVRDEIQLFCQKVAEQMNLCIVDVNNSKDSCYGIGPVDFLEAVSSAEYILTDSFHCSAFSVLFQKKFSIYDRDTNDMDVSNRTDELLGLFGLRHVKNLFSLDELVCQKPLDGIMIDKILEPEKKKAEDFVKKNLEGDI